MLVTQLKQKFSWLKNSEKAAETKNRIFILAILVVDLCVLVNGWMRKKFTIFFFLNIDTTLSVSLMCLLKC